MSIPPNIKDTFLMSEDEVIEKVISYLRKKKYIVETANKGFAHGVDVIAYNPITASHFYIECKGNIKNNYAVKQQFTSLQIAHHFDVQLGQLCQVIHRYRNERNTQFGMASPHTLRIQNRIDAVRTALKRLPIELIWVEPKKVWIEKP